MRNGNRWNETYNNFQDEDDEAPDFEIKTLQDAHDYLSHLDIAVKDLRHQLKRTGTIPELDKLGNFPEFAEIIQHLKNMRKDSQAVKRGIRDVVKKAFGKDYEFEAESRYAVLQALMLSVLRRMRFFK